MGVQQIEPTSDVRVFSPGYWRVARDGDALCVVPTGFDARTRFTAGVTTLMLLGVVLLPGIALEMRAVFGCATAIIGGTILGLLRWLQNYQQQQGPFLRISPNGFEVRGGQLISFDQFAGFEITARKERLARGWRTVHLLLLKRSAAAAFEIVVGFSNRAVERLQQDLEAHVRSIAVR